MWPDNETDLDFLNFTGVADTVGEIIVQADGRPISIGVAGAWGVGKSSMIRLVQRSLEKRHKEGADRDFVFVEFNAWLYQGYDDARAALMEVIGDTLLKEAKKRATGLEKAQEFIKRVRWFRVAKLAATSWAAIHLGIPHPALLGGAAAVGSHFLSGSETAEEIKAAKDVAADVGKAAPGLLKPEETPNPPQEIQALRTSFEETLSALDVTLVVLIDDLDRCLPETTISTLEAIRLFLFMEDTAFVIAADDGMIKHAVKRHFDGVTDELATNYFDKLIQVPIRVPPLGTQEVRAYMMMLFVQNSALDGGVKEHIRTKICERLGQTWQGKRVDGAFLQTLHKFPSDLLGRLETADRLAHMMTTAKGIAGNPRLIKRFLNALAIRMTISRAHGVGVDETVLVKMMLFERLGNPQAYAELAKSVSESSDGKAEHLKNWEADALAGKDLKLPPPWDGPFFKEWLELSPPLAEQDLRGVLYVSREHAPLITPQDRLSSEAAEVLAALIDSPGVADSQKGRLARIPRLEMAIIMDKLLNEARKVQEWGAPPILGACLAVAGADPTQGQRIAAFLIDRPASQIKPSIVPKIEDQPWAAEVFAAWEKADVAGTVKRAIKQKDK
jgi:predicted KAP-like P-loop ATPase